MFVDSLTEQTTSITDMILALQSIATIVMLRRSHVRLRVTMIWTFDNHGIFHLVQMLSLFLIMIGLKISHRPIPHSKHR